MTHVFRNYAELYWAKGLSIVPLEPQTKRPARELTGWQGHLSSLPSEATRRDWLERYSDRGIGLLLGSAIGDAERLEAIDVDDDRLVRPLLAILGC